MLSPETLTRHELIGLPVRVVDAHSDDAVDVTGRVVSESQRTLTVRTPTGDKRVPKRGTTFEFALVEAPTVRDPSVDDQFVGGSNAGSAHAPTDEAAGDRKAPGSASELGSDTAGVRPRQSGPSASSVDRDADGASRSVRECEDVVYVTVDGAQLLSRPAERTERGVSTWR